MTRMLLRTAEQYINIEYSINVQGLKKLIYKDQNPYVQGIDLTSTQIIRYTLRSKLESRYEQN